MTIDGGVSPAPTMTLSFISDPQDRSHAEL
jgi:hypothetical protein